jgi:hypothetical protein
MKKLQEKNLRIYSHPAFATGPTQCSTQTPWRLWALHRSTKYCVTFHYNFPQLSTLSYLMCLDYYFGYLNFLESRNKNRQFMDQQLFVFQNEGAGLLDRWFSLVGY